jgi:hypothetical protein
MASTLSLRLSIRPSARHLRKCRVWTSTPLPKIRSSRSYARLCSWYQSSGTSCVSCLLGVHSLQCAHTDLLVTHTSASLSLLWPIWPVWTNCTTCELSRYAIDGFQRQWYHYRHSKQSLGLRTTIRSNADTAFNYRTSCIISIVFHSCTSQPSVT